MTLNQVVEEYLNSNGIKKEYFASYIGCGLSKCTMWFKGERKLNTEQLQKTHEFLSGKHIKPVEDIMKEEQLIVTVDIDDKSYTYLIQLLTNKFYNTTDISELQQINKLYKILKFQSETWLSKI